MIGVSKLYCGTVEPSDALRYGRRSKDLPSHLLQFSSDKKPVVVWNTTRACNLRCVHCYASAVNQSHETELTTEQGYTLIEDMAAYGVPVLLFSGGEPLLRADLMELAGFASDRGMRAVLSTNGTLIDEQTAVQLKDSGIAYVGISIDGLEKVNDRFRGVKGAFKAALKGIENCKMAGLKVGLRFTMNKANADQVPGIFDLVEEMDLERVCFYHLVYSGRGSALRDQDLSHDDTRRLVDYIIDRTKDMHERGLKKEVLTVDNHADGIYLYLRMLKERSPRVSEVLELLRMNGGNSSGEGLACVSWDGMVYADQFWREHCFGNVLSRPFSEIWSDQTEPLLSQLREKKGHVTGRCARCRWLDICGGNFRARAEAVTGEIWGEDPACYLTDDEIGQQ
ncbi:MAG: 12,18-didecarboxysiroheme deacetylase [Deltaproteobacteria bacterium]|nr:12,18-didecarboxysiroheme deacetylase [Deltaproteobacteria bacterium]MBW2076940.1 12,18-didecarboxysiroheme deacetylase [Deltaproteobacteria bacterium]MBW2310641.1 12,18-didecarboxysiroheme deacetylase [Deltaproteobacteria bacterium]RLB32222.1 MAG: 12,18-didecarboxysiroheme deacetylase [Deltaproteobacteria bacterium]